MFRPIMCKLPHNCYISGLDEVLITIPPYLSRVLFQLYILTLGVDTLVLYFIMFVLQGIKYYISYMHHCTLCNDYHVATLTHVFIY